MQRVPTEAFLVIQKIQVFCTSLMDALHYVAADSMDDEQVKCWEEVHLKKKKRNLQFCHFLDFPHIPKTIHK